jgi:hypothetical protein
MTSEVGGGAFGCYLLAHKYLKRKAVKYCTIDGAKLHHRSNSLMNKALRAAAQKWSPDSLVVLVKIFTGNSRQVLL